jgi:hypothetical protein
MCAIFRATRGKSHKKTGNYRYTNTNKKKRATNPKQANE